MINNMSSQIAGPCTALLPSAGRGNSLTRSHKVSVEKNFTRIWNTIIKHKEIRAKLVWDMSPISRMVLKNLG
jgi:hypothetical protein